MAVVFLAINGFGLGHLIRSTIVSHALASIGERPVIFTEGKYRPAALTKFPIRLVPPLARCDGRGSKARILRTTVDGRDLAAGGACRGYASGPH